MSKLWSAKWPIETGIYWFYGWRTMWERNQSPLSPRLLCVTIRQGNNGLFATAEGAFIHESDHPIGMWQPINYPMVPSIDDINESNS
jgi:hypothetical protein